jgi:hypothetical protein
MVAEASMPSTTDAPNAKFDEDVSELTDIDEEDSVNEARSLSNDEAEKDGHEVEAVEDKKRERGEIEITKE